MSELTNRVDGTSVDDNTLRTDSSFEKHSLKQAPSRSSGMKTNNNIEVRGLHSELKIESNASGLSINEDVLD